MITYDKYVDDCIAKGYKATMTKKQFNEMIGFEIELAIPTLTIRPKNKRPKECSLKTYNEVQK